MIDPTKFTFMNKYARLLQTKPLAFAIQIAIGLALLTGILSLSACSNKPDPRKIESKRFDAIPATYIHDTANPEASPVARRILNYLYELPSRSDKRVISGQLGFFNAEVSDGEQRLQTLHQQTGKWAGLTGTDYHLWDRDHRNNLSEPNQFLIDYWNQGGLVTVSWHANNPWTGGDDNDMYIGSGLSELTTPGTQAHQNWMIMLDDVAGGLQELQDAGVVVIWRPFHEMNGGWFWWFGDYDGEQFKEVWRYMFNYFTYTKGLDNLLWAFSPWSYDTAAAAEQWKATPNYYPGDDYVDIVGLDKYKPLDEDPLRLYGYDRLLATGKPVALLEFGPSPASAWPDRPNYDYSNLIRDIRNEYPQIVLFQTWEWHWAIPENENATGLMDDPWIITREDLALGLLRKWYIPLILKKW